MNSNVKTKLFIGEIGNNARLSPVREYQKFVEDNPKIKIESVNILQLNKVLLTYREQ